MSRPGARVVLHLLLGFANENNVLTDRLVREHTAARHVAPFGWCCRAWVGGTILDKCRAGTMQYVVVQLVCAVVVVVLEGLGLYDAVRARVYAMRLCVCVCVPTAALNVTSSCTLGRRGTLRRTTAAICTSQSS
jgi:hypothetical protein